jgi:hypothetical protein
MDEALAWLKHQGIPHQKLTDHQIRIGRRLAWYPVRGTIVNGSVRLEERGRLALEFIIAGMGDEL